MVILAKRFMVSKEKEKVCFTYKILDFSLFLTNLFVHIVTVFDVIFNMIV